MMNKIYIGQLEQTARIKLFILDTGVLSTHYEFANNVEVIHGDSSYNDDDVLLGHGTHLASLIIGKTCGVIKNPSIIPSRDKKYNYRIDKIYEFPVCKGIFGDCFFQDIEDGYQFVAAMLEDLNSAYYNYYSKNSDNVYRAVINLSFSSPGALPDYFQFTTDAHLSNIVQFGGVPVAAIGNFGNGFCQSYPATSEYAISVGAYDENYNMFKYSNYGSCVDVYAPGKQVYGAYIFNDTSYFAFSGTSQSTAIITGLITQMLILDSNLTLNDIRHVLKKQENYKTMGNCPSNTNTNTNASQSDECDAIAMNCTQMVSSILENNDDTTITTTTTTLTTSPSVQPTNAPSEPLYCCHAIYGYYTSLCEGIATKNDCEETRRVCYYNPDDCHSQTEFECIKNGRTCSTDEECCSENCQVRRRTWSACARQRY